MRADESSGNVFADLDLPHEAEGMLKVELARHRRDDPLLETEWLET